MPESSGLFFGSCRHSSREGDCFRLTVDHFAVRPFVVLIPGALICSRCLVLPVVVVVVREKSLLSSKGIVVLSVRETSASLSLMRTSFEWQMSVSCVFDSHVCVGVHRVFCGGSHVVVIVYACDVRCVACVNVYVRVEGKGCVCVEVLMMVVGRGMAQKEPQEAGKRRRQKEGKRKKKRRGRSQFLVPFMCLLCQPQCLLVPPVA